VWRTDGQTDGQKSCSTSRLHVLHAMHRTIINWCITGSHSLYPLPRSSRVRDMCALCLSRFFYTHVYYASRRMSKALSYKKLIRRWDSERELSVRRHRTRTCTTKYNRLVHKFRQGSTRLCVGTHVYQIQWNNAI